MQYIVNPSANEEVLDAMLFDDDHLLLIDAEATTRCTKQGVVAACFSPTGDRVALALRGGCIQICLNDGTETERIPIPPSLSSTHVAHHISWIFDKELLVVYWDSVATSPSLYCIDLTCSYTNLGELFLDFDATCETTRFYSTVYHNLSSDIPSLIFLTSSQQPDVVVAIKTPEGQWHQVFLEELFQVVLPYTSDVQAMPRGIALDCTASDPIHNLFPDLPAMAPVPVLYLLNSGGEIQMYHCISKELASNPIETAVDDAHTAKPTHDASIPETCEPATTSSNEFAQPPPTTSEVTSQTPAVASEYLPSSIDATSDLTGNSNQSFNEDTLSAFSREVRQFLASELKHPLLLNEDEIPPLPELTDIAHTAPSLKTHHKPPPHKQSPKPSDLPPFALNAQEFAEYRKLGLHLNFAAATVGLYKERWNKYVADAGNINSLSADIDALWGQVNNAHQKALAAHNSSINLLKSLKFSSERLAVSEQLLSQLPQTDCSFAETDFAYQAIATKTLVNLEAKLASFQNILNVINRQFFSQQRIWAQVLDKPELNSFLSSLQSIYAHSLDLQGRVALIKSSNVRLAFIYSSCSEKKTRKHFVEGIAASASIPIPATAVAQANSKIAQQNWLDEFQSAYISLHSSS
ncbi:hypothetical protein DSO57_1011521 [Entomophthora muscae]|uniref:Uncharacterized protein n=1 Tax=Entomophthora muscae TaxID=34485 RepID=A0ACC2SJ37_9FUNG|nr:hypothetical protein DSO57_1011521 [Entomophthora muscae]